MVSPKDVKPLRKFGLEPVGDIPWGTHLCQFYETKQDLVDILVPYFAEGLRNNEFCMWITSAPLGVAEAKKALRKAVPNLDECIQKGQIEILSYEDWYLLGGKFGADRVLQGWVDKEKAAISRGFDGLRLTGNTFWIKRSLWKGFTDYEETVNNVIGEHQMLALCTYCLKKCSGSDIIDVVRNHVGTLVKRSGEWVLVEDSWQRKQAEKDLRTSEKRLRSTLDKMMEGCQIISPDWRYLYINDAAAKQGRSTGEKTLGRTMMEVYPDIEKTRLFSELQRCMTEKTSIVMDNEFTFPDGEKDWFKLSIQPVPEGLLIMSEDITERKRAEQALLESDRDLNRAQAVAKTGSWRLDVRGNELLWSDETYRMFGIPKGTPLTYEIFLGTVHPEDRGHVDRKWQAALRGEPYDIEHRIVVKGAIKWVHERAELEFNKNGELLGGFGTVQEITEIKEMQEKLEEHAKHLADLVEERTKKLKDAERLATIGETAGMVGHDIRNPLQSIIGEVYLAKDELKPLPDCEAKNSLKETMTIIEEQIEYINKIVTDLQDFAKPLIPCMEEADLENIIKTVSSTMEIPENVEFTYLLEQGFPKFKADTAYLKRTLINLFSNAVQAMPNGGKLTLQALRENCSVVITVEDTGVGIPEEFKSKMFQPLCTTKSKGQGFGLAVCKRLVEAMGGTVTFDSQEGKGTKFIIRLPLLTL